MFFWFSCIAAGLSLCLSVWALFRPVARKAEEGGRGGPLLRLVWPWVLALVPACRPFIPWRMRRALARRMLTAGLAPSLQPEHVVAMQVLAAAALALAAVLSAHAGGILGGMPLAPGLLAGLAGAGWPRRWLAGLAQRRQAQMLREFPFLLDMTTLCVEAGLNLHGALQQAARHGPAGPLRDELRRALADMRAGMPRAQALNALAERSGLAALRSLATALSQADELGMSLGPLLRSQSEQRRAERFLRAEKLALEAPVKMLFPMVFCIFPCTFLVIGFPIAVKLLAADP